MCRYGLREYKETFVCLDCQIGWKSHAFDHGLDNGSWHCGRCGKPGINVARDFHVPRKNNKNQWRKIRRMLAEGVPSRFRTCGCGGSGPLPRTYSDSKNWESRFDTQPDRYGRTRTIYQHKTRTVMRGRKRVVAQLG